MTKTIHYFLGSVSTLLLIAKYQMRKNAPKSITYNAILLLQKCIFIFLDAGCLMSYPPFILLRVGYLLLRRGYLLLIPIIFLPIKTKPIRYYFKDN